MTALMSAPWLMHSRNGSIHWQEHVPLQWLHIVGSRNEHVVEGPLASTHTRSHICFLFFVRPHSGAVVRTMCAPMPRRRRRNAFAHLGLRYRTQTRVDAHMEQSGNDADRCTSPMALLTLSLISHACERQWRPRKGYNGWPGAAASITRSCTTARRATAPVSERSLQRDRSGKEKGDSRRAALPSNPARPRCGLSRVLPRNGDEAADRPLDAIIPGPQPAIHAGTLSPRMPPSPSRPHLQAPMRTARGSAARVPAAGRHALCLDGHGWHYPRQQQYKRGPSTTNIGPSANRNRRHLRSDHDAMASRDKNEPADSRQRPCKTSPNLVETSTKMVDANPNLLTTSTKLVETSPS